MAGIKWSKEEEEIIKKLYGKVPVSEIIKVLKSRTQDAITHKAAKLGLKKKVGGEIDYEYLKKLVTIIKE